MMTPAVCKRVSEALGSATSLGCGSMRTFGGGAGYCYCAVGWLAHYAGYEFPKVRAPNTAVLEWVEEEYGISTVDLNDIMSQNDSFVPPQQYTGKKVKVERRDHMVGWVKDNCQEAV